jgi:hypothetical protein
MQVSIRPQMPAQALSCLQIFVAEYHTRAGFASGAVSSILAFMLQGDLAVDRRMV